MVAEAANQKSRNGVSLPSIVGGKTGTPERYRIARQKRYFSKRANKEIVHDEVEKKNDGWYMFFVKPTAGKHALAVCVRMERASGSGAAVRFTNSVVLEALYQNGYINSHK